MPIESVRLHSYGGESAGSIGNREGSTVNKNNSSAESAGSIAKKYSNGIYAQSGPAESAGSIAKKYSDSIYAQCSPAESAGSIGKKSPNSIYVHSGPAESAGSVANQPLSNPHFNSLSYGIEDSYYYEEKKKPSAIGIIGGLAAAVALGIVALGYGHKKEVLSNMKDGWFKKTLSHLENPSKKCHSWCHTAKTKGLEIWDKIKSVFKRK